MFKITLNNLNSMCAQGYLILQHCKNKFLNVVDFFSHYLTLAGTTLEASSGTLNVQVSKKKKRTIFV